MQRFLGVLRNLYAGFLLVSLVILLPLWFLSYSLGSVVFSPPRLRQALTAGFTEGDLAPTLMKWMAEQVAIQRGIEGVPAREPDFYSLTRLITLDEWRQVRRAAVPDLFIRDWVERLTTGFFAWQADPQADPDIVIPLEELRSRLDGPNRVNVTDVIYASLEPCSADQEDALLIDRIASRPGEFIWCQPSQASQAYQKSQLERALAKISASLPGGIKLVPYERVHPAGAGIAAVSDRQWVSFFRGVVSWGWLVPLGVLALLAPLALWDKRSLAIYWGFPLLAGGGLGFVLSFFYVTAAQNLLVRALLLAKVPVWVAEVVSNSARQLLDTLQQPLQTWAGMVGSLGLLLVMPWIIAWWWRQDRSKTRQELPPNGITL